VNKIAIRAENLSKKFKLFHEPPLTFQKALHNLLKGKRNYQEVMALRGINFTLETGESVGLIGANASGKSTLLRVIAGIYTRTAGSVFSSGKIAPFLELGSGFNMEFTGIENLQIYAAIFGLSRRQLIEKLPEIREFSGLGDFLDVPMRQYSFGMRMRLAFSFAAHIDPDILLIDEMLAVGDLSFREKCFTRLNELKKSGKTLLLVSHQIDEIERLCEKTIWLDQGSIKEIGQTQKVIQEYKKFMRDK
jgi:ABC-2 type transport system ATP-binding protein